jgi:hypothetical protein
MASPDPRPRPVGGLGHGARIAARSAWRADWMPWIYLKPALRSIAAVHVRNLTGRRGCFGHRGDWRVGSVFPVPFGFVCLAYFDRRIWRTLGAPWAGWFCLEGWAGPKGRKGKRGGAGAQRGFWSCRLLGVGSGVGDGVGLGQNLGGLFGRFCGPVWLVCPSAFVRWLSFITVPLRENRPAETSLRLNASACFFCLGPASTLRQNCPFDPARQGPLLAREPCLARTGAMNRAPT